MAQKFFLTASPVRRRWILYLSGVVILVAGYAGAALIWRAQDRMDKENAYLTANDAASLSPLESRTGAQQLEVEYGKTGLLAARWAEWIKSLTHGRRLAEVLILFSSITAIGCFLAGGRLTEPDL